MVANSAHQFVADMIKSGYVWMRVGKRYWRVRINGQTQLWKRDVERFRIPIKAGLYVYDEITNADPIDTWHFQSKFITCDQDPNPLIMQADALWIVRNIQAQAQ